MSKRTYKVGYILHMTQAMKDKIMEQIPDQDKPKWDKWFRVGFPFSIRELFLDKERALIEGQTVRKMASQDRDWSMSLPLDVLDLAESDKTFLGIKRRKKADRG